MSMDDFMRSLSDQQKAMFMAALQDSGTPPEKEVTGDEDDSEWTTTMPPHIKKEFGDKDSTDEFSMGTSPKKKTAVRASGKNEFVDGGECKTVDVDTPEFTPTQRRRKPVETVSVKCSVCGKSEKIVKKFIHGEFHRCSKCCGR
jgi:hypothetical protein